MSLVVLCDFDGTVIDIDTCVFILAKFAETEWKIFDIQFEKGEITLEECLRKQFSLVKVPKTIILEEIERVTSVRPNFEKLIEYCRAHKIPLILVSAGLDFVIEHFLKINNWQGLVEVHAARAKCTVNGIKFSFPRLFDKASVNFKDDLVTYYKKQGKKVIYIGDGFSDFHATKNANYSFAIKDSKLAELLKKEGIPYREISDFQEVVEAIKAIASLTE
jgi:2,3-diketo-5-methylthio-1-phosphopentane phosphatase